MRALVATVLVALLVAGCGVPSSSPPSSGTAQSGTFDGAAAYAYVAGLATHTDGSPRYRIPGTASHDEAALWLAQQLAVPGWTVHWQNFTGAAYQATPKGSVSGYASPGGACSPADYTALANRTFSNLYAVLPAASPTNHSLVLGAHWDSQPRAVEDPDPAHHDDPVPAADDGASGVGVLLQAMRELVRPGAVRPAAQVVVFLSDGEDGFDSCYPLAGPIVFARNATTRGLAGQFWLLDMVGDPQAKYVREGFSLTSDPKLLNLAWTHGRALDPQAFTLQDNSVYDDHSAFLDVGVAAIDLIDMGRQPSATGGFPPQWHTRDDTMAHISSGMLATVGQVVVDTLRDPALDATWA